MTKYSKLGLLGAILAVAGAATIPTISWKPGDHSRPQPVKVKPPTASTPERAGTAPSDAVVLFDGHGLGAWQHHDGSAPKWKIGDGYFEVTPRSGDLVTKQPFGDMQLHVEWATPNPSHGSDQEPGNSGVYLMSRYEIQVIESFNNVTYPDGQAGSVYCQYPPLVNSSLPPGDWQSYDIIWHGPRFTGADLKDPATVTVLHNGVLVQDHVTLTGPTDWLKRPPYKAHNAKEPLLLQDHGQPSRFRNIWLRELKEPAN
jgi:hypothetical protein